MTCKARGKTTPDRAAGGTVSMDASEARFAHVS
jgi:hypothetical protein